MKVLDLSCSQQHAFEGWFASEHDFQQQLEQGRVECPLCGDSAVRKMLSAPRLNLGATAPAASIGANRAGDSDSPIVPVTTPDRQRVGPPAHLQAAWLKMARQVLAHTDDVGHAFAEEARKIHYGEAPERGIRGRATREETEALLEEGIAILPLALPRALKETLQ